MGGEEWCCGYPLFGAGMKEDVAKLAQHNIAQAQSIGAPSPGRHLLLLLPHLAPPLPRIQERHRPMGL